MGRGPINAERLLSVGGYGIIFVTLGSCKELHGSDASGSIPAIQNP